MINTPRPNRALRMALPLGIVLALTLAGCASPARVDQMQAATTPSTRSAAANSPLRTQVAIKDVTGGQETNPMWSSNVSSADFERALEASLRNTGLLSENRQSSKYVLTAHMLKLDKPFAGVSMTVTATVQYTLVDRASGKEVFTQTITRPYTAEWNSAFLGTERIKLANEGAARTNIEQLIDALVALKADNIAVR